MNQKQAKEVKAAYKEQEPNTFEPIGKLPSIFQAEYMQLELEDPFRYWFNSIWKGIAGIHEGILLKFICGIQKLR